MVSFDLENVQYISRPTSVLFNCPDLVQDLTSHHHETKIGHQDCSKISDLVNSMAKMAHMRQVHEIETILEESVQVADDEPVNPRFQFLRKKSKMIRKAFISKVDSAVSLNSMVIHEDK